MYLQQRWQVGWSISLNRALLMRSLGFQNWFTSPFSAPTWLKSRFWFKERSFFGSLEANLCFYFQFNTFYKEYVAWYLLNILIHTMVARSHCHWCEVLFSKTSLLYIYIINVNYILKNALFGIKTVLVMYLRPPMSV